MEKNDEEDSSDEADADEDNADDNDAQWLKKLRYIMGNLIAKIVVRIYIIDAQYADNAKDGSQPNAYAWAICDKSQLVILEEASMEIIYTGIKSRIGMGRTIRTIYGAIMKPYLSEMTSADLVWLTNDDDLEPFLEVARTEYKPLCIQIQLAQGDEMA